jgi:iron(III) transport system substrate-binding protein
MKKTVLLIPAALLSLALTACGSPAATNDDSVEKVDSHAKEVFDKFNGMTGAERTEALVAAAQEEGELSVYTSNTDLDVIVEAFDEEYGIDVNVYRGNSESVLQRVLQESKAGFAGVDLVETNSGELNILSSEGLFYPYKSELRDAVRPEGQKEFWTADRFNAFIVAWNTDLLPNGEVPKTLEDFADPKWKGKISMELGDVDWFSAMWNYYLENGKSEDEVKAMFNAMAQNSKVVKGHTVQAELLSAGEFVAGVSLYSHSVQEGTEEGRPITWRSNAVEPVQPIVLRPNGGGLVGTAQHPAAALLFMDFLISEGQKAIEAEYRIGSVPGPSDPLAGLETIQVDEDEMLNNAEKWDKLYASIIQGGEVIEE